MPFRTLHVLSRPLLRYLGSPINCFRIHRNRLGPSFTSWYERAPPRGSEQILRLLNPRRFNEVSPPNDQSRNGRAKSIYTLAPSVIQSDTGSESISPIRKQSMKSMMIVQKFLESLYSCQKLKLGRATKKGNPVKLRASCATSACITRLCL